MGQVWCGLQRHVLHDLGCCYVLLSLLYTMLVTVVYYVPSASSARLGVDFSTTFSIPLGENKSAQLATMRRAPASQPPTRTLYLTHSPPLPPVGLSPFRLTHTSPLRSPSIGIHVPHAPYTTTPLVGFELIFSPPPFIHVYPQEMSLAKSILKQSSSLLFPKMPSQATPAKPS